MEITESRYGGYIALDGYDYRDELREAGFSWNPDRRVWATHSPSAALSLSEYLEDGLADKLRAAEAAAAEELAKADAALPLLRPPGKAASKCVADVSINGAVVRVALAERDEDFREIVKDAGFRWSGSAWERTTNGFTGSAVDRAADISQRLLKARFVVRVRDAEAHRKAIAGDYEDEVTMWVKCVTAGEHKGWLQVSWAHGDDMYSEVKNLPGARYTQGAVVCPPDAAADVLDFAAANGFGVTASARAVLAAREAELAGGLVVNLAPRKKKAAPVKMGGRKPKLVAVAGEIDDDLRDTD